MKKVQSLQVAADTGPVEKLTEINETRQALRWLARELAWERVLTGLRDDDTATPERAAA